jgi:hypothetical protein
MRGRTLMGMLPSTMGTLLSTVLLQACSGSDPTNGPYAVPSPLQVVTASGDLTGPLAAFQTLAGNPANGATAGEQPSGRREIRWDAVPPEATNTDAFPNDFFRKNGLIYAASSGLRVSDNDFSDINPAYQDQFNAFSAPKSFSAIGTQVADLSFRVAGSDTAASVTGFGVVFSDVDVDGSASITPYTSDGKSLGRYDAPVRTDSAGHSFIGVVFADPVVARVVVTSGQAPLGSDRNDISAGGDQDLVVMDDFIFGEPRSANQAIPVDRYGAGT